ncbi:HD domain-containing protein [Bacillus mobilis]|uniref:HD-GYP domain-containing protein n=1 Tax=Bacillus mobilis TaxID=2026190 RepID=UPI002E1CC815|nr:HD domain-containing protein [Bacillus mobilis]
MTYLLTVYKKEIIKLLHFNKKMELLIKDETMQHSIRCAVLASKFGMYLELSKKDLNNLIVGALLHDIGKFLLPKEVLYKKGRLSEEEFAIIKTHTINIPNIMVNDDVKDIIQQHHERLDGTGYPFSLTRKQIHPLAKIMSIIDVYDALSHKRSYKEAFTKEAVLKLMVAESDKQFDSELLKGFISYLEKEGL